MTDGFFFSFKIVYATDRYCIIMAQAIAPNVPTAYPNTANKTPTGANAGLKAAATTGAEAAPPIFACEPTAT